MPLKIAGHTGLFDLVVIIRGGGSQTDLSWFDNYDIAYHITQFPLPVVTGIGHEKNISVTDMVASMSLKTPTAVADFLIDRMASAENELNTLGAGIRDSTRIIIEESKNRLETYGIKLLPLARMMISANRERLSGKMMELIRTGRENTSRSGVVTATLLSRLFSSVKTYSSDRIRIINAASGNLISCTLNHVNNNRIRLTGLDNTLNILNPVNVLRRGYTITSLKGKILKNMNSLNTDDIIDTLFTDGTIKSKVVDKNKGCL